MPAYSFAEVPLGWTWCLRQGAIGCGCRRLSL